MRPCGDSPTSSGSSPQPALIALPASPPGLWSVTVSGRKHSVRLCSPRQAEAERWGAALRKVIASKAPLETPTQLLLRDIQVLERGIRGGRGGSWVQQLSAFVGAPFSITVTLSLASRRVAGTWRLWPSFTAETQFCGTPVGPCTPRSCPCPMESAPQVSGQGP